MTWRGNASGACRKNRRETAASFLRRMVSTSWFGESHSYQSKHLVIPGSWAAMASLLSASSACVSDHGVRLGDRFRHQLQRHPDDRLLRSQKPGTTALRTGSRVIAEHAR